MPDCMPSDYWLLILTYVLPPLGALLSATSLWVAARARTISGDARSTSRAVAHATGVLPERRVRSALRPGAPDRRK
jgi:hypothetical protein